MRKLCLAVALLAWCVSAAERNIIFFITDDESPTLGCYGDTVAHTPHIDALAADGTVFLNAFATTASCSASRSVVMSGLHNHANGQYGHTHHFHKFASYHDVAALALPRVLKNEGYRTVHIGKYHVAPEEVYHFDEYRRGHSRNPIQMANAVADVIQSDDESPFFLYFGTSDPHRGGGVDKTVPGKFKPDLFGNRPEGGSHDNVTETFFKPGNVPVPSFLPDSPECRQELAQYYQSCARIDTGVGELVKLLKGADKYDSTLIVFTSDHGMAFPGGKTTVYEGGLKVPFVVRNPYETKRGVRSEAMISHVDITPSLLDFAGGLDSKVNGPKKWVDPKAYWKGKDYASKENRGGGYKFRSYHGRSWLPILAQNDDLSRSEIHASHTFHEIQMYYPMRVIRDRNYKLIWNIASGLPYPFASDLWAASTWQAQWAKGKDAPFGQKTVDEYVNRPAFELYDIRKDPHEGNNLADNPEFANVLSNYKSKLKAFQQKMNDPWITKWRYE
ncbi:MAG: N-sulfoglucosamine sulfohydrolase [Rhodothermales bacterium]|jgi:N-sulfoglucosamine sulfohydrolase